MGELGTHTYLEAWNVQISWIVKHLLIPREASSGRGSYRCPVTSVAVMAGLRCDEKLAFASVFLHDSSPSSTNHAWT